MNKNSRPRRSVLYMPGSNERALEKGKMLAADGLILDLEDAVAPISKLKAREQIAKALRDGGYGKREIVVRVNSLDSQWGDDDLKMAATIGADAILLPKVESKDDILQAEKILNGSGGAEDLPLWCMMETPLGILHAEEVAFASPRIGCLVLGTSDLAKDLNAHHTLNRMPFLTSLEFKDTEFIRILLFKILFLKVSVKIFVFSEFDNNLFFFLIALIISNLSEKKDFFLYS